MARTVVVTGYSFGSKLVDLEDGRQLPITGMYDADGDFTRDSESAATIVFGAGDTWGAIETADFYCPTLH